MRRCPRTPWITRIMVRCDDAPGHHDARNPFAGAPSLDDEAAGKVEREVAKKKDARAKADHCIVEAEVPLHLEFRYAQVGAVEVCEQIDEHQVGNEAPGHAAARL